LRPEDEFRPEDVTNCEDEFPEDEVSKDELPPRRERFSLNEQDGSLETMGRK